MGLVKSTKLREGDGQIKIYVGIIPVGFDRSSTPCDRLVLKAELDLRHARYIHPEVSNRITWTEPQRLGDVTFRLFRAADINLTKSDYGMRVDKISIQRQRVLAFGDAPHGALREDLDIS